MGIGPGKYDGLCTLVRELSSAEGAAVIVFNGDKGIGFSVQGPGEFLTALPNVLEQVAKQIRADLGNAEPNEKGPLH